MMSDNLVPGQQTDQLPQRCGLIAIVGRPNVGKSTLLNALVGQKISITSRKAQTTRHRITGVRTLGEAQFVFVDTPGFQTRHSTALNRSLNRTVQGVLADVDVVLFVVEAGRFNLDDAKVLALLPPGKPAVLVSVQGGNYAPGTPREGWDHATGWMRRILADVWDLDLDVVEMPFTLVGVNPRSTSSPISPRLITASSARA